MSKTLAEALRTRQDDRAALLARITRMLEGDDRVAAAWLFGSLGRGGEDDWSDIDIFVAVADADFSGVSQGRRAFTARVGEPLIVVEAPSCAPPSGAFLTVCYDSPSGLLIVDWYWQPQSLARVWRPTRLLFDRVGLPHWDGPGGWELGQTPERTWQEQAEREVNALWWGLAHSAKYLARSPLTWEVEGRMSSQRQELEDAYRFFGEPPPDLRDWAWPQRPEGKVELLRRLAALAEALTPSIRKQGISIRPAVTPSLGRLLGVVELACRGATLGRIST